jgi:hypothetical protein
LAREAWDANKHVPAILAQLQHLEFASS